MKLEYRGYTIRSSGKLLYKIVEPVGERPFFTRCVSVAAARVLIDCRLDDGRVMTPAEHAIVHPVAPTSQTAT